MGLITPPVNATLTHRHPRGPVLSWSGLLVGARPKLPSLGELPHRIYTSSGRAALLAALEHMSLAAGSTVLTSAYHCPTMIAPIVYAGLKPVFYPLGGDGLPCLQLMEAMPLAGVRAMIVPHLFGIPRSLQLTQDWCRHRNIALIEDCAHSYFGWAGDRPVGHWGDYAIASLTKFFPLGEAGLLTSVHHQLETNQLTAPGARTELKSLFNTLESAFRNSSWLGIKNLVNHYPRIKDLPKPTAQAVSNFKPAINVQAAMAACDMSRVRQHPATLAMALHRWSARQSDIEQRQINFRTLQACFKSANGARVLFDPDVSKIAPYALPLWIEDPDRADRVYAAARMAQMPVLRWDSAWPDSDCKGLAEGQRRQILQILCHQSLRASDARAIGEKLLLCLDD